MIKVDKTKCIGCGACVASCPEVFEMDGSYSRVKVKNPDSKTCNCKLDEIAAACPAGAISIKNSQ